MSLARVADTDTNAAGDSGTIRDNAWKTALYDQIDARWFELNSNPTGTQNNLSITSGSREADVLYLSNASDLTITGFAAPASPAKQGKPLLVYSVGVGNVFFKHNNAGSSSGNKLFNIITAGDTVLKGGPVGGCALFRYDALTGYWRLIQWDQGGWLSYTPTLAATSGTFTSATVTGKYELRTGRKVLVQFVISIVTNGTAAGATTVTLPSGFGNSAIPATGVVVEVSTTGVMGSIEIPSAGSVARVRKYDASYLGANGYTIQGQFEYETT